jgi:hypothetical protein
MNPSCLATSFRPRRKGFGMSLARLVVPAVRTPGVTKAEVARDYGGSRRWIYELCRPNRCRRGSGARASIAAAPDGNAQSLSRKARFHGARRSRSSPASATAESGRARSSFEPLGRTPLRSIPASIPRRSPPIRWILAAPGSCSTQTMGALRPLLSARRRSVSVVRAINSLTSRSKLALVRQRRERGRGQGALRILQA